MRYNFLPLLAALAVTAGCASDPVGMPSDLTPSFGISGGPTVLTLVDEVGAPLAGQTGVFKDFRYRCGGEWAPYTAYTTDGNGQFTVTPDCSGYTGNWDNKVTVRLNQVSLEQDVTGNPVFHAARVNANLKSCTGPIVAVPGAGGSVEQGTGSWVTVGTTGPSGTISFYTFPGNNQVRMTYNRKSVTLVPTIVPGTNQVDFQTTKVTLASGGAIWSNTGGSWWQFAKPSMDLLPGTYNFYNNSASVASPLVAPLSVSGCELVHPAASDNEPPLVTNVAVSPNPAPFTTGSYALTAHATDNVAVTAASYTIDAGAPVAFVFSPGTPVSLAATLGPLDVGMYDVCVTAEDAEGNDSDPACTELTVIDNEAPVVTNVAVTPNPGPCTATSCTLTASASDNEAVTAASMTLNDGAPVPFAFGAGAAVALSATLGSIGVGVHDVCVTASDAAGNASATECIMLVVYDPNAGFVTGGGWINSPAGAYVPDAGLVGKATFGFVSKYLKGRDVPTGNTQFQFKAGDLNFSSTSYEWLVVSGARAQFKGAGTINGAGDFRFMLTVIDGQISGGGGSHKFRIRIWDDAGGGLVYDNMLSAPDSGDPTTVLGGGSIVIHVPKR